MLRYLSSLPRKISSQSPATLVRSLSTTPRLSLSLESPTYPGLFYHSLPAPPNSYSLSFLPTPPPNPAFSPTTIGTLSPLIATSESHQPPELVPRNFVENPEFRKLLLEVLKGVVPLDEGFQTLAKIRKYGFIHICDARNPPDPNRVPDPSDIIASVLIQDDKIVPESFEASGTHRLVTMDGMFKLEEAIAKQVRAAMESARMIEEEMMRDGSAVE